jgi:hypothetical protein
MNNNVNSMDPFGFEANIKLITADTDADDLPLETTAASAAQIGKIIENSISDYLQLFNGGQISLKIQASGTEYIIEENILKIKAENSPVIQKPEDYTRNYWVETGN